MREIPEPRLDPRLARRLDDKKTTLDMYRPLPPHIVRRLHEELRVLLTYHSTGIEGNTLDLGETQLVIEEGITIGGHSLKEHLEATNHAEAYSMLTSLVDRNEPLTEEHIFALHRLVLEKLHPEAGQWRIGFVSLARSRHQPPHAKQVPSLMAAWLAWLRTDALQYHPILRGAIAHHQFVAIHPFADGNGRVGRLLLNLHLMRDGFAPALLLREQRLQYIRALAQADAGDYDALANVIGRAVERGLQVYLDACTAAPEDEYLLLADLEEPTGLTKEHLGWLIRQGRLPGTKRGGRWYTTIAAVESYKAGVERGEVPRGRPPQKS